MASRAYVSLGSNMGDRRAAIIRALNGMAALPETSVAAVSSIYETAPWGYTDQPAFLNCVAALDTQMAPEPLMQSLLDLETKLGRVRDIHWGPRVIDLDLLLYDSATVHTELLTLPHPLLTARRFVLVPLLELGDDLVVDGCRLSSHLAALDAVNAVNNEVVLWGPPPGCSGTLYV